MPTHTARAAASAPVISTRSVLARSRMNSIAETKNGASKGIRFTRVFSQSQSPLRPIVCQPPPRFCNSNQGYQFIRLRLSKSELSAKVIGFIGPAPPSNWRLRPDSASQKVAPRLEPRTPVAAGTPALFTKCHALIQSLIKLRGFVQVSEPRPSHLCPVHFVSAEMRRQT